MAEGLILVEPWITRRASLRIRAKCVTKDSMDEQEAALERLREFLRFSYVTGNQVARRIGVNDTTLYS